MTLDRIYWRIDSKDKKKFQQMATEENLTLSEFLTKAVFHYIRCRKKDIEGDQPDSDKSQAQSDVPLGMPNEMSPEKKAFIERIKEESTKELPPPPCHYCSKGYRDPKTGIHYFYCAKPSKTKGKGVIPMPQSACIKCWERTEYIKNQKENKSIPIAVKHKFERYYCALENQWYTHNQIEELSEKLPCLKDPMKVCPNKECERKIKRLIGFNDYFDT